MNQENTEVIEEVLDDNLEGQTVQDQINELKALETRTPEQEAELKKLKNQAAVDKRIGVEVAKRHQERERAERAEHELEQLRLQHTNTVEKKPALGQAETIMINNKQFYTDRGLVQLVQANQMSQEEAYEHQEERREEKAVARLKQDMQATSDQQIRNDTKEEVLREYPEFNPSHRDHNPNDPLFKEANELWQSGLHSNPRGLKIAIEKAKRILGKDVKRPDLSDELSVTRNQEPATRQGEKSKKVMLTDAETEMAWSFYRTQKNPKTGKSYTQTEAVQAAIKAKEIRQSRRV